MKALRQTAILDLIRNEDIETQEELANRLKKQGYAVTQATISRDIKEMRLLKVLTPNGVYKYATSENMESGLAERFIRMFSESVLSLSHAYNQIVLKTLAGSANAAAEAIDSLHWPEIIGTLAGDNTILLLLRDMSEMDDVLSRINSMMK